jgi:molybdopterin-guanine dinucleotide biosynthesis protein A
MLRRLAAAVHRTADGAVLVDPAGREQWLFGVWRWPFLTGTLTSESDWTGAAVRAVFAGATVTTVPGTAQDAADVDRDEDLRRWGIDPGADAFRTTQQP